MKGLQVIDDGEDSYGERTSYSVGDYEVVNYQPSGRRTRLYALRYCGNSDVLGSDRWIRTTTTGASLDRLKLLARLLDGTDLGLDDLPEDGTNASRYVDSSAPVPAALVGSGSAAVAAYLRAMFDGSNSRIASVLDVGERTVETYVSDVRSGDRL